MNSMPETVTVGKACELLHMSRPTFYRKAKRHPKLLGTRPDGEGKRLVYVKDIAEYLESGRAMKRTRKF